MSNLTNPISNSPAPLNTVNSVVAATGNLYEAIYVPVPLSEMPVGCVLPPLTDNPIDLPNISPPDIIKACVPIFTEHPIIPFPAVAVPENCPDGLVFTVGTLGIMSTMSDTEPVTTLPVSIQQNPDNFCTYDLNLPDLIIPCYPNGPQFYGEASITIVDLNADSVSTSVIGFTQSDEAPCLWNMSGNVTITLPQIPCPTGITFGTGSMRITSTSNSFVDTKTMSISRSNDDPCNYELDLPGIKIPCYPDGPSISGGINFTVLDRESVVSSTTSSFSVNASDSCAFILSGDVSVDVPCSSGINSAPQSTTWNILQPAGIDVSPVAETVSISQVRDNMCNLVVNMPDTIIPCYPDGINFTGAVTFKTTDGAVVGSIDLSNNGPARDMSQPCVWNLDNVITLPTPNCSAGIDFSTDVVIKLNSSTTLSTIVPSPVTATSSYQTLQLVPSSEPDNCGAVLTGVINLGLAPFAIECPSLAAGANNKITMNFVSSSTTANVTTSPSFSLIPSDSGCGFQFDHTLFNIPALVCAKGYSNGVSSVNVVKSDGTPVPQVNPLTLAPADPANPQCGVALIGTITLPVITDVSGSSVAPFSLFNGGYPLGSTVSVVFPEGGDCNFVAVGTPEGSNVIPTAISPTSPQADDYWRNTGCDDFKEFKPFQVIRTNDIIPSSFIESNSAYVITTTTTTSTSTVTTANPNSPPITNTTFAYASTGTYAPPTTTTTKVGVTTTVVNTTVTPAKNIVKVVPKSYLFNNTTAATNTQPLQIFGLNFPFELDPGEKVYLGMTFDATVNGVPKFMYAGIYKTTSTGFWDESMDAGLVVVPPVQILDAKQTLDGALKTATPVQANILELGTYVEDLTALMVGVGTNTIASGPSGVIDGRTNTVINVKGESQLQILRDMEGVMLLSLGALTDTRPREYKYFVLIAHADDTTVDTTSTVPGNDASAAPSGLTLMQGTSLYNVTQDLSSHQLLIATTYNNMPILQPIDYSGSTKLADTLPAPILNWAIDPAEPDVIFIWFNFNADPTLDYVQLKNGNQLSIGPAASDIKIYYTLDGSPPTINTKSNTGCLLFYTQDATVDTATPLGMHAGVYNDANMYISGGIRWFAKANNCISSKAGLWSMAAILQATAATSTGTITPG